MIFFKNLFKTITSPGYWQDLGLASRGKRHARERDAQLENLGRERTESPGPPPLSANGCHHPASGLTTSPRCHTGQRGLPIWKEEASPFLGGTSRDLALSCTSVSPESSAWGPSRAHTVRSFLGHSSAAAGSAQVFSVSGHRGSVAATPPAGVSELAAWGRGPALQCSAVTQDFPEQHLDLQWLTD